MLEAFKLKTTTAEKAKEKIMNKEQYDGACANTPNWDKNNVSNIELTHIIGAGGATAQVRQGGLDNGHVTALVESIFTQQQKVPVTVEDVGKRPDGTTQYRLVDGEHRYRAIMKLNSANPNDHRWKHIKAVTKIFSDDWKRLEFQSKSNNHGLPSKGNANSDAALMLGHVVDGSIPGLPASLKSLAGSHGRNSTSPAKYLTDLQKALKTLYPQMPAQKRKVVAKAFIRTIPGKMRNYSASDAKADFDEWAGNTNVALTSPYKVHTVKNYNYIDWQLIARLFATKSDTQNNCNITVIYWSDIQGKDHDALDRHREDMISKINKRNASSMLKKGRRLTDRVFMAPQKQNSNCDEHGFYEVEMDKNGKFTSPPDIGWDT